MSKTTSEIDFFTTDFYIVYFIFSAKFKSISNLNTKAHNGLVCFRQEMISLKGKYL